MVGKAVEFNPSIRGLAYPVSRRASRGEQKCGVEEAGSIARRKFRGAILRNMEQRQRLFGGGERGALLIAINEVQPQSAGVERDAAFQIRDPQVNRPELKGFTQATSVTIAVLERREFFTSFRYKLHAVGRLLERVLHERALLPCSPGL